jgi:hypothetical protein
MALSKLNAHLRRMGASTFGQMFEELTDICDLFSAVECGMFFCVAGYGSS